MSKEYPESLLDFEHWFRTDQACSDYLAKLRWPEGFVCPHCRARGFWPSHGGLFRCHRCRRDVSVISGTAFHRSRLPLRTWFRIAWWATNQKSGLSALSLQRMMGLGSYETAWLSLQKLRRAMVRLGRDPLTGKIEVDETYIGGLGKGRYPNRNKALIGIAAEIRGEGIGRVRIQRIGDNSARSLVPFVRSCVSQGSTIVTDGAWGYRPIVDHGYVHKPTVLDGRGREASTAVLPRVHIVASLMKRWLLGVHQGRVGGDRLDPYLDEFAFRFNRRQSPNRGMLFYRLLQQCVVHEPLTYADITRKKL
jgi:hypothetical protein